MRGHGGTGAGGGGGGNGLAAVAAQVRARRGELSRAVAETLAASGAGDLDGVDQALVPVSELFVARFEQGRPLEAEDLGAVRPFGADRARHDVPLQTVLDAATAGVVRAWQLFAEEAAAVAARHPGTPAAVDRWFEAALHATTDAIARGYLDARLGTARSPVVNLLGRVGGDADELARRARALGWTAATRHGLILLAGRAAAPVAAARLDDARLALVASLPGALGGACRFDPLPHAVVVAAADARSWAGLAHRSAAAVAERHGLVALVSDRVASACEVNQLHRSLIDRLPLAVDVARAPGVVGEPSLRVFRLLASLPAPARDEAIGDLVSRLRTIRGSSEGPELIETAHAVADRGGVVNAAAVLGIDRRTVARRLARLADRLGVSLDARADRLLVELALHALQLP